MFGLVDEEKGGIVAYFLDESVAETVMSDLNSAYGFESSSEDARFWVTHPLDKEQICDLLTSVAKHIKEM